MCSESILSSVNLLLLYNVVCHFGCIKLHQNKEQLLQRLLLGNPRGSDVSIVCSSGYDKCWLCRPVNLLQSKQNHFIYIIIFGALASDVLANIFNPSTEFLAEAYDSVWYSSEHIVFYFLLPAILLFFQSIDFLCSSDTTDTVLFPTAGLCECSN